MILRNLATQVESDSGSHTCGLGGEERVEDFLKDGWLDADAVVVNADAYVAVLLGDVQVSNSWRS